MYALWLVIFMGGVSCDAVAVCEHDVASCEAVVVSCEAPVRLSACLNEASAYTLAEMALPGAADGEIEPIYGLGCSTDLSAGWPATVDFDQDALGWAL